MWSNEAANNIYQQLHYSAFTVLVTESDQSNLIAIHHIWRQTILGDIRNWYQMKVNLESNLPNFEFFRFFEFYD